MLQYDKIGMSATKILYKIGEIALPWGSPLKILKLLDKQLLIETWKLLLFKNDFTIYFILYKVEN
jgi:hypothetical protein